MSNSNGIPHPTDPRFQDLTGQTFGRWTVQAYAEKTKSGRCGWVCSCACGTRKRVATSSLTRGISRSCGCLRLEVCTAKALKHGGVGAAEYTAWENMWGRCTNPKNKSFPTYSSRAPDEAFRDFSVFLTEVGAKPTREHSLDRIDNARGYIKGNLRWALRAVQANNTKANINLLCKRTGEERTLAQACKASGIPYHRAYQRLTKLGWYVEDALEGRYTSA